MDLCIRAREQRARRIVHINFNQQRSRRDVDGFSSAYELSLKSAPGKLSETETCCHPDFHPLRVFLRNVYVNTQLSGLSDVEEIGFHAATATGVDQVSDIGISRGDHTIEWSVDLLERLQCLELLDVCLIGFNDRLVSVVGAYRVIHVLPRNSIRLQ